MVLVDEGGKIVIVIMREVALRVASPPHETWDLVWDGHGFRGGNKWMEEAMGWASK